MVAIKEVRESNSALKTELPNPIALFAGGTSGIGESTLKQLAKHTPSPKIYFTSRTEEKAAKFKEELKSINSSGEYISLKINDLSLLENADAVCDEFKRREKKLDILFLSQGFINFGGRSENAEGLDSLLSIRYYSRMRMIYNLLPLLSASPSARVVSVLAGGLEGKVVEDDLGLKHNFGIINCANTSSTMTTLFMEHLAKENPSVAFVHEYPGFVITPLVTNGMGIVNPIGRWFLTWILVPLARPFLLSQDEAGERGLFHATSSRYPPKASGGKTETKGSSGEVGTGCYSVGAKGDAASNPVLVPYRTKGGVSQKVWEHTMGEFERIAKMGHEE